MISDTCRTRTDFLEFCTGSAFGTVTHAARLISEPHGLHRVVYPLKHFQLDWMSSWPLTDGSDIPCVFRGLLGFFADIAFGTRYRAFGLALSLNEASSLSGHPL